MRRPLSGVLGRRLQDVRRLRDAVLRVSLLDAAGHDGLAVLPGLPAAPGADAVIYVNVEAIKSEGRGSAGGNGWHDTDSISEAVEAELGRFQSTWDALGHGGAITYVITVATEASPRRTVQGWPLPEPAR